MSPFTVKPVLEGDLVTLRPVRAADVPTMHRILTGDAEALALTGTPPSASPPPLESLQEIYARWAGTTDRLILAVVDRASGQMVGEVVLNEWDGASHSCNLRILIGPAGRDRGLGTEAVRLVVAHALTIPDLHGVTLKVYGFNPRARRVYERTGFRLDHTEHRPLEGHDDPVEVHHLAIRAEHLTRGSSW